MSDLGVVDPLHVPAPAADLVARVRAWPAVAQAFVALTILDAVARTIGLIEPAVGGDALGLFTSYVPRDAWILLPAIVLLRRPSAPADTPWVYRGALFIAIVTLLARPTAWIIGNALPAESVDPHVLLGDAEVLLTGAALVVLGIGVSRLNPSLPLVATAGLANLAAAAVAAAYLLELLASFASNNRVDVFASSLPWWAYAAPVASGFAVAWWLRAVVRGFDDPTRSERATRTATAGALLWALGLFVNAVLGTLARTLGFFVPAEIEIAFGTLQAVGPLLIVVAFGLGLADPLRPLAGEWAAALRADPRADAAAETSPR